MFDISSDTKHLATTTGSPLWAQTDGKKPALLEKLIPLLTFPEEVSQYYKELPTPEATDRKRAAPLSDEQHSVKQAKTETSANPKDGGSLVVEGHFAEGYETTDYLGRSFLEPPPALVTSLESGATPNCRPPSQLKGNYKGGHAAGVQVVQWAPPRYGHLLFSSDMGGVVKLWETNSRNLVSTFKAHQEPIKSADLTPDATLFSTGSSDGRVTLWDVEHATCTQTLTNKDGLPVGQHLHHPSDPFTQLLVALDKKVVLYDTRVSCSKHQREYTGHMGTIFNVTLLSGGSKFLTTAEDRTLRTWDFRIPIQVKQFADAAMHAISHVVHHPSQPFLAAQSLDNRITVFKDEGGGKLKSLHQRSFTGHTITGTRCQLAFSADGKFISSGDISGNLHVWDWESGASVKTFKAHKDMLTSHVWHPADKSKVVTASWDNTVKLWA